MGKEIDNDETQHIVVANWNETIKEPLAAFHIPTMEATDNDKTAC